MFRKYFTFLLLILLAGSSLVHGRDIVNILQTGEKFTLQTWGNSDFLVRNVPVEFINVNPEADLLWGAGFGFIVENKNIGPFFRYPNHTRLKTGNIQRRHPILDFNIPLQAAYAFGLNEIGTKPPSAILYMKHQEPFTWSDIRQHLINMGIDNAYFKGVVTSRDVWGHYLKEDYFDLLKATNRPHFASFYKDRATAKVQGYFLSNPETLNSELFNSRRRSRGPATECLIFETSVFITDVPTLNNPGLMVDFYNTLAPVQMGFTPELPDDWKLLRGTIFVYSLDSIHQNH